MIPTLAVVLLGWWLYQSASVYSPDRWFDPFEPFSVMTCLTQWGIALIVLNRWFGRRTLGSRDGKK